MLFDNQTNSTSLSVKTLGGDSVVRIIGDRSSGKTTYLASLAYWPNASPDNLVQTVSPVGEDSEELVNKARDIL